MDILCWLNGEYVSVVVLPGAALPAKNRWHELCSCIDTCTHVQNKLLAEEGVYLVYPPMLYDDPFRTNCNDAKGYRKAVQESRR